MKRDAWDRTAMHTPVLTHADAQYHWVMKRTMVDLDPGEDTYPQVGHAEGAAPPKTKNLYTRIVQAAVALLVLVVDSAGCVH